MGLIGWIIKVIKEIWADTGGRITHKILGAGAETEKGRSFREFLAALDPFKLGSPLTKGEAHYVNDVVAYHIYGEPGESGGVSKENRGPLMLAALFEGVLQEGVKEDFGILRHGWVADYMADQFCQNAGEHFIFMFLTRTGPIGFQVLATIKALKLNPGSTNTLFQKFMATVIWAPLFFFYGSVVFAMITTGILNIFRPTIFWALIISAIAFSRWYGGYGMYLPVLKEETVPSAIIAAVTWAFTLGVIVKGVEYFGISIKGFVDLVRLPIVQANPLFLGMAELTQGFDWGTLLLIWGAAGLGNLYYGEWVEEHVHDSDHANDLAKMMRTIDRKIDKL